MQDDVADLLKADIILPESSVKPKLELGFLNECQKWFAGLASGIQGVRFRSPIVLGIRDYSRELAVQIELHADRTRAARLSQDRDHPSGAGRGPRRGFLRPIRRLPEAPGSDWDVSGAAKGGGR